MPDLTPAEAQRLLEGSTPGPWFAGTDVTDECGGYFDHRYVYAFSEHPPPYEDSEVGCERMGLWCDTHDEACVAETHNWTPLTPAEHDANQRLIAAAPSLAATVLSQADAIAALEGERDRLRVVARWFVEAADTRVTDLGVRGARANVNDPYFDSYHDARMPLVVLLDELDEAVCTCEAPLHTSTGKYPSDRNCPIHGESVAALAADEEGGAPDVR